MPTLVFKSCATPDTTWTSNWGFRRRELIDAVDGAHALIIRSATKVDGPTLEAAKDLIVVGRAGIGLDNVDVAKATELGVMVVNAPVSNILSAAEQTMALLLAQARNIPQAHSALKAGKWERSKWEGVELHGKTLGCRRTRQDRRPRGPARVGLRHATDRLRPVHHRRTRATHGRRTRRPRHAARSRATSSRFTYPRRKRRRTSWTPRRWRRPSRACASSTSPEAASSTRADLADAIRNGHVQGAALDVFEKEPTTESPLFELPSVVVVPHLGASTFEAQDKAGITIAEQVQLALAGDFVPYAVNVAAGEVSNAVRPFMGLAEVLGRFIGGLLDGKPADLEVNYLGELAGSGTKILTLCALKGLLTATGHDGVSFVNAPQLAEDHNLTYSEISTVESPEYVNQISVRSGDHAVSGTLVTIGTRLETRIVGVDGHSVEIPPAASMLVVHNDDRPGMIGMVGVALGEAGVSISSMAVGPDQRTKTALMVLSTEIPTPIDVIDRLRDDATVFKTFT